MSLSLDPSTAFRVPDYSLSPGQLTSRGFMQHIQLGQLLRSQYGAPLLDHIRSPQQLYVRSTNYIRTIRSVSALLTALLPQVTTAFKQKVGISYVENEMEECMHGVCAPGAALSGDVFASMISLSTTYSATVDRRTRQFPQRQEPPQ